MSKVLLRNLIFLAVIVVSALWLKSADAHAVYAMPECSEQNCDGNRFACLAECEAQFGIEGEKAESCSHQCSSEAQRCDAVMCSSEPGPPPAPSPCGPFSLWCE